MFVLILGLSIFFYISDAYVMHHQNAQEEPKSITMFLNGQDNPESRRRATVQDKQLKRNSEDVLEELYNNAPDFATKGQSGDKARSKHHKQKFRSNEMDWTKLINGVVKYFTKSDVIHPRSNTGARGETKIDLVKLVNAAFSYLASLNTKYRANSMTTTQLEPRPIEFRSKDDTSLLYELNAKKIVDGIADLLSSKNMKSYIDSIARKAATVYQAVTKDH